MALAPTQNTPRKPVRPTHLPRGRWLGDLGELNAAEKLLVECCARGEPWEPNGWDRTRPAAATPANTIRAALIRFLALGGDAAHPVHEAGVTVGGGWIAGALDLHQCHAPVRLALVKCCFPVMPILIAAHLPELALSGSTVPGLDADLMKVTRGVFLCDGFTASGAVRLPSAEIGGDLACTGGSFTNEGGDALSADGLKVAGSVFLREATFNGAVRLLGAEIGGELACTGGSFTNAGSDALIADRLKVAGGVFLKDGFAAIGQVRLLGAEISGNLECNRGRFVNEGGNALSADGLKVAGSVFLRDGFTSSGSVRLLDAQIGGVLECTAGRFTNVGSDALIADGMKVAGSVILRGATVSGAIGLGAARLGSLIDDEGCWTSGENMLDGLIYDRIIGPTDAASRIAWLKTQHADQLDRRDWTPQPWEQLIKVLGEMGHPADAAVVAMEKQRMMRRAGKIGGPVLQVLHRLYGALAGYGHKPGRIVSSMLIIWLACALCFEVGREWGYFGPSNPIIHTSAAFEACGAPGDTLPDGRPKYFWHTPACPTPPEYSTLFPLLYSLDLILPLVDLQQDKDWAPMVVNTNGEQLFWGYLLRALLWFEILFGWFASLMFVAIVSRLVEKD
jgi:hypothetical protein